MKTVNYLSLIIFSWLGSAQGIRPSEPIGADQFRKLQALIKPGLGEDRWAAIPWLTDLWQARQLAARQGKPILLWEMRPIWCHRKRRAR